MTMDADSWNQRYLDGQTGWDRGETHPALKSWLVQGNLQPGKIIVPGCGRGYEVIELAEHGFEVTAVDFAPEPIEHLRQRLQGQDLNVQLVQQNMFDFAPPQPVGLVYEQTCLCAMEPELRESYENTVYDWLVPGGKFLALFAQKEGNHDVGPPFHCDLDQMKNLFPESRWDWPKEPLEVFRHDTVPIQESAAILSKKS